MNDNPLLQKKIAEINTALKNNTEDLYELIGSIRDLFSHYTMKLDVEAEIIQELWQLLFIIFSTSESYNNCFDAIDAMDEIRMYTSKHGINLDITALKDWKNKHCDAKNVSSEILECIDNILL